MWEVKQQTNQNAEITSCLYISFFISNNGGRLKNFIDLEVGVGNKEVKILNSRSLFQLVFV
jgi:hypothetical protein